METTRVTTTASAPRYREMLTVGIGGVLGANARYGVSEWVRGWWGSSFPWGTFVVNLTGSFALGFFLTLLARRHRGRPWLRLFVATGFLGGYTTFSTFSYEAVRLIQDGQLLRALTYVSASLIASLAAVAVGAALADGFSG